MPAALRDVDLHVRGGEILGIAGLVGSGRTELLRALAGAEPTARGACWSAARRSRGRAACRAALATGSRSRRRTARRRASCSASAAPTNVVLSDLGDRSRRGRHQPRRGRSRRADASERLGFDPKRLSAPAGTLSGGNQQKLVISNGCTAARACCCSTSRPAASTSAPSRDLYDHARLLADAGMAIIVVSSELEEVVELSDRCSCSPRPSIATLAHGEATVERILALVFRVSDEAA